MNKVHGPPIGRLDSLFNGNVFLLYYIIILHKNINYLC